MRGPGQQVGGGRHDQHEVGLLAEAHVRDLVDVVEQTSVRTGWPDSAAQVAAPTNFSAVGGRDDGDVVAGLGELAQHLARLVRRDAAADAEDDARAHGRRIRTARSSCGIIGSHRHRRGSGLDRLSGQQPR